MTPEDPFTSVKWDRREETVNQHAGSESVSELATSPQNPGSSEPETDPRESETPFFHSGAGSGHQTPKLTENIDTEDGNEDFERKNEPIPEIPVVSAPSDPVLSHTASPSAPESQENTHDQPSDTLAEKNDTENAQAEDLHSESSYDKNVDRANTYHENMEPEMTQNDSLGTNLTQASIHSNQAQSSSSEAGAQAIASQGTSSAGAKEEWRQIQAFSKMADKFAQYDICSQVSDPLSDRDGNSKAFISYLVVTNTNHPDVLRLQAKTAEEGFSTVKVRRRYGDFRFLHDCLMADFPQLLVPPLPAKSNFKYLTGDTFSTPFVHKRLHSLDRFISYICQHKLLSQSSVFHYFISDSAEWATFTQNLKILKDEDSESSIVGKVVNEELLTETVMNFFTSSKHKRETNKDILEISDKLKKLYENLVKLDRIFSKLNKKNSDLKTDYEGFSHQINKLAALNESSKTSEAEAGAEGSKNMGNLETEANVTANFRLFSDSLVYFSENWAKLYKHVDESFLVALKDCSKYIIRLTNLIELQHNKKIDLQVLQDYLHKARTDLANLSGSAHSAHGQAHHSAPNPALIGQYSGGLVNNTAQLIKDTISTSATPHIGSSQAENKKWKLQNRISQLESEISAQTLLVNDLTSRIINEEYPNWDEFNKAQLKKAMADLCDQKISFYKGMMENWSDVEAKLIKRLEQLE